MKHQLTTVTSIKKLKPQLAIIISVKKMKLHLTIKAFTKILKKIYIFIYGMALTWHQRGQFEYKFQKVIRPNITAALVQKLKPQLTIAVSAPIVN